MNSTPPRPTSTMRLTALQPPPPTPTTLILAPRRTSGSSVSRSFSASNPLGPRGSLILCPPVPGRWRSVMSEKFLEDSPKPARDAAERAGADARRLRRAVAVRVEHQPYRRGEHRAVHVIGETADPGRVSA